MKKKILAIDQGEHLGGAERFFAELLERMPEYDIHLITSGNPLYKRLYKKNTVSIHEIDLPKLKPIRFQNFIKYRRAQNSIHKIVDEIKPDLILSNTVRTHLLISPIAREKNIPLVWMAHDRTFPSSLLRWFGKYPRTIISCSKYVENFYKKYLQRKDVQFEVIYPFGIEKAEMNELKKIRKLKKVGMVGKFMPWKNQKTFLELIAEINSSYFRYRFDIIGSAYEGNEESEKYLAECMTFIRENKLKKIVSIKKSVPNVLKEIATWEVLVHCSKEPEPLGRVILEGLSAGCAVIASPFGGPAEVIRHRETGVLAKPDVPSLKKELLDLLNNPEERVKMANAARTEVQEKYNWQNIINIMKELI